MQPQNYRLAKRAPWHLVARHFLFGIISLCVTVWITYKQQVWQWHFDALIHMENTIWLAGIITGFSVWLEEWYRAAKAILDHPGEEKKRPTTGSKYLWTDGATAYFLCFPIALAALVITVFGTVADFLMALPLWGCFAFFRYRLHNEHILYIDYAAEKIAICRFGWFWWKKTDQYALHDFSGITKIEREHSADVLLVGKLNKPDLNFEHIDRSNFRYLAMRALNKLRQATGLPILEK